MQRLLRQTLHTARRCDEAFDAHALPMHTRLYASEWPRTVCWGKRPQRPGAVCPRWTRTSPSLPPHAHLRQTESAQGPRGDRWRDGSHSGDGRDLAIKVEPRAFWLLKLRPKGTHALSDGSTEVTEAGACPGSPARVVCPLQDTHSVLAAVTLHDITLLPGGGQGVTCSNKKTPEFHIDTSAAPKIKVLGLRGPCATHSPNHRDPGRGRAPSRTHPPPPYPVRARARVSLRPE